MTETEAPAIEVIEARLGKAWDAMEAEKPYGSAGAPLQAEETPRAWSFKDDSVARKFDQHVREQLPWYDSLSHYVADLAVSFLTQGGRVYDIGASTGNVYRLLAGDLDAKQARLRSVEPSHEMARHFGTLCPGAELVVLDAEHLDYAADRPDVVILMLTLMFMKPAGRTAFLAKVFEAVVPGGAVIVVDKGYLDVPAVAVAAKAAQLAGKRRSGTPGDAYVTKELALRGEQRPTSIPRLMELAHSHGFEGELFFRFGEFYGVLLVKRAL